MRRAPQPPPTEKKIMVRIRGDHPHNGRIGWITVKDGKCETINLFGTGMVKINFENDEGCFSELKNLEEIEPTSPPPPRKRKRS